jgi:hypothetical protein
MMPARVLAQVLRLGSQWLEVKAAALRRTHPARPRALSPVVNVLLILALFVAVKVKLFVAAGVLAGLLGLAAWRAWA